MSNDQLPKGYKQTEVGVIPEDWIVQPLSSVASLDVGYAFKSSWYQKDNGIPLLRGENVGYGRLDWTDLRSLPEDKAKPFLAYRLCPNDIVIGMDRTFTKSGTKISLLQEKDCPCLLVQRVGKFVPLKCSHSFLWALLSSPKFQLYLLLQQKGMDIPHLSRTEILEPYVALPPTKAEQESIAQALSDVDRLIAALEKAIAKKRAIKTATMQQLLTGKKRLPGFGEGKGYQQTEVGLIPEDWQVVPLERLAVITRLAGAEYSSVWKETPNGEIIALRGFNIGKNTIIEKDFVWISNELSLKLRRSRLYKGDVVYPCVGTIGNAVVIEEDDKYHIQQNIAKITSNSNLLSPYYLANYLMSFYGDAEVERFNASSSQPNVLVGSLRQYRIPLPPLLEEQQAISTFLSDMDAEIAALETRLAKTQSIKQGMMQELLTGRTRLV